jgi:hypothetical protein
MLCVSSMMPNARFCIVFVVFNKEGSVLYQARFNVILKKSLRHSYNICHLPIPPQMSRLSFRHISSNCHRGEIIADTSLQQYRYTVQPHSIPGNDSVFLPGFRLDRSDPCGIHTCSHRFQDGEH